jgi:uncharacterized protein (DUF362 family)
MLITRRNIFQTVAGAAAAAQTTRAQQPATAAEVAFPVVHPFEGRSAVALTTGNDRRTNAYQALKAIDDQIQPVLKRKKYAVIKPNIVSVTNPLAATHTDALRGILDYLSERFKGPVVIAESSAGETWKGYENFYYTRLTSEYRKKQLKLIDLNEEAKYDVMPLLSPDLHVQPVRLAARLLDPEAFVICSAILKTHNTVIATLSVKNMVLGAPLHQAPKETPRWSDKRKYHGGVRQTHYNMLLTAQKMKPFWGVTLIDGFEGMEGNGPSSGTPVESRIAIASTDYIAADRVGIEAMGIDPKWPAYLNYCAQCGLGQYDLSKIEVRGPALASVKKTYRLHKDIDRELQWMGPLQDIPPKLG